MSDVIAYPEYTDSAEIGGGIKEFLLDVTKGSLVIALGGSECVKLEKSVLYKHTRTGKAY